MNIRKFVAAAAAVSLLAAPAVALAFDDQDANTQGFKYNPTFEGVRPANTGLVSSIINIVNALLVLAAITAVVFIIIGGVRYITAQGDEDAVAQAKNTIIYAIIGIIIIILAAVIVSFFTSNLPGY